MALPRWITPLPCANLGGFTAVRATKVVQAKDSEHHPKPMTAKRSLGLVIDGAAISRDHMHVTKWAAHTTRKQPINDVGDNRCTRDLQCANRPLPIALNKGDYQQSRHGRSNRRKNQKTDRGKPEISYGTIGRKSMHCQAALIFEISHGASKSRSMIHPYPVVKRDPSRLRARRGILRSIAQVRCSLSAAISKPSDLPMKNHGWRRSTTSFLLARDPALHSGSSGHNRSQEISMAQMPPL